MKSFLQFVSESTAVQQATRMGLTGDGHGGWYKNGEFVAKTEKGRLKFFNKRQRIGQQDPKQSEKEKNLSSPNTQAPPEGQKDEPSAAPETAPVQDTKDATPAEQELIAKGIDPNAKVQFDPPENPRTKGSLTIAFGRFNPPHAGHEKLLNTVAASSEDNEYIIVPTKTEGKDTDPLDYKTKVSVMKDMFPDHSDRILDDDNTRTIFDVLKKANADGYSSVRLVGGSDRESFYDQISNKYNGQLFDFDSVETISAGDRNEESDDAIEAMSASVQRKHVMNGDFAAFYGNLHRPIEVVNPETGRVVKEMQPMIDEKKAEDLYFKLRKAMKIEEGTELWRIAPRLDWKNLRENYIKENIFKLGQLVQDFNSGLIGRILRRGANHLICVTEDNMMFKSWIKDVTETTKVTNVSGVPADQRLVGTDALRKYTEKMVPGHTWGIQFINKYRKK